MFSIYKMSELVDEVFCAQDANKNDERCSCYNVIMRDCETERDIPGCKESMDYVEETLSNIPETNGPHKAVARLELMQRLYCPGRVCVGTNKYKPPIMDDLRKTSPCGFSLDICVQNTEIDTAVDTEVFNECKINENFIGTDPWELEFDEDEKEDIARLADERNERLAVKKLEIEENQRAREERAKQNKTYTYVGILIFILLVLFLVLK
jgi:hypothetical protein